MAAQVVYSFLIFLFPLAVYCLVLAYVNRSRRPIFVGGLWDCVGLLFGLSGFLLFTAPLLLSTIVYRLFDLLPIGPEIALTVSRAGLLWLAYFAILALIAAWMLALRRHKTVIYNVDTDRVGPRLAQVLAEAGLDSISRRGWLVIAPVEAFSTPAPAAPRLGDEFTATAPRVGVLGSAPAKALHALPGSPRYAEVAVDSFPTFCNVTLHWDNYSLAVRRDVEDRLGRALEDAAAVDNPAAGWFLGFSGMIFGAIILLVAFFVVLLIFGRPH